MRLLRREDLAWALPFSDRAWKATARAQKSRSEMGQTVNNRTSLRC